MSARLDKPTQRTIADLMGLAVTTVSRALKNDPKIAEATRQRVAEVAAEIGYVPDHAAQRLRTGKTRVISLILNPHEEILGFGNSLISGLTQSLEGMGYHLSITPCFSEGDELSPVRDVVRHGLADGVVLTRTQNFDERIRYLLEQDFPFVSHGRTDFSQPHHFVDFDNEDFAQMAANRLISLGCDKLAIILPPAELTFHQHLRYGFMKSVREKGVDFAIPQSVTLASSAQEIRAWATSLCSSERDFKRIGFICPGEACYLAVRSAMRDLGLEWSKDYRAVAKTNSAILHEIDPELDCVLEDIKDAGFRMGRNLLAHLEGKEPGILTHVQRPEPNFEFERKN